MKKINAILKPMVAGHLKKVGTMQQNTANVSGTKKEELIRLIGNMSVTGLNTKSAS